MQNSLHNILPIIFVVVLVGWGMYRRVRRTVGLQRLLPGRLRTRIIIFTIVSVVIVLHAFASPKAAIADGVGILLGCAIGIVAIRTTAFEERNDELYYRPNMWLGFGLIAVLIGRIIYKVTYLYTHFGEIENQQQSAAAGSHVQVTSYTSDPYIGGLFFVLATYYILYYVWLLRRRSVVHHSKS